MNLISSSRYILILLFAYSIIGSTNGQDTFYYKTDSFTKNDTIFNTYLALTDLEKLDPLINYNASVALNLVDLFFIGIHPELTFRNPNRFNEKLKIRLSFQRHATNYSSEAFFEGQENTKISINSMGLALGKNRYLYRKGKESWYIGIDAIAAGNYVLYETIVVQQPPYQNHYLRHNKMSYLVGIGLDYAKVVRFTNKLYAEFTPLTVSYVKGIQNSGTNLYNPIYGSFLLRNSDNLILSSLAFRNVVKLKYCFDVKKRGNS